MLGWQHAGGRLEQHHRERALLELRPSVGWEGAVILTAGMSAALAADRAGVEGGWGADRDQAGDPDRR